VCVDRAAFIGGTYLARRDESDGADIACRPIIELAADASRIAQLAKAITEAARKIPRVP
jgi:hypothetical protein